MMQYPDEGQGRDGNCTLYYLDASKHLQNPGSDVSSFIFRLSAISATILCAFQHSYPHAALELVSNIW